MSPRRVLLALCIAWACADARAGLPECKSVGFPDLPDGFTDLGGSVIGDVDGVEYGIAHVCKGRKHQLWLQRAAGRDQDGHVTWIPLAKLALPAVADDQGLVYGHWSTSRSAAEPDPAIIAIVRATDKAEYTGVVRAWRANGPTRAIQEIPVRGIVCANDDAGL